MVSPRELRFVLVVDDYEAALHLYRGVFGLHVLEEFDSPGHGAVLSVPSATFEVVDREHAQMVDEIEAGGPSDYRIRIAVAVDDLAESADAVLATGAEAMTRPVETPWGDHNQRFQARDGTQLTLFRSPERRTSPPQEG